MARRDPTACALEHARAAGESVFLLPDSAAVAVWGGSRHEPVWPEGVPWDAMDLCAVPVHAAIAALRTRVEIHGTAVRRHHGCDGMYVALSAPGRDLQPWWTGLYRVEVPRAVPLADRASTAIGLVGLSIQRQHRLPSEARALVYTAAGNRGFVTPRPPPATPAEIVSQSRVGHLSEDPDLLHYLFEHTASPPSDLPTQRKPSGGGWLLG